MEKEFRGEQHYAVSKLGIPTHIKDAHNSPEDYYCPHCGCKMLKRCGNIRTWHFAHDWRNATEFQKKCSYETYLHGYAKLRIKQWIDESKSITLYYTESTDCKLYSTCNLIKTDNCRRYREKSFDLKEVFNKCVLESPVKESNGNYRADLLLKSDNNPSRHILIEIKVSHGCTKQKITSGAAIIEFVIAKEEDVEYIISHDIKESDKVQYYGFKRMRNDTEGLITPIHNLQKFILYKSGKTFCTPTDCQSIGIHKNSSLFEFTTYCTQDDYWKLYQFGLMKARERGFIIPYCFFCEHYIYTEECGCSKCQINNTFIEKGADALNCSFYTFKPSVFDKIKSYPFEQIALWIHPPLDAPQ